MKAQLVRDIILIAAALAIAVIALLPAQGPHPNESPPEQRGDVPQAREAAVVGTGEPSPVRLRRDDHGLDADPAAAAVFTFAVGSTWVYHVEGPKELVPANRWTMEVRSLPVGAAPGEVTVNFGGERIIYPI